VAALAEAGRRVGVDLCTGKTVERIHREGAKITGVRVAGEGDVAARHVVVAAGAWSGAIEGLPPVPLRPVKGQIIRLRDPHGPGLLDRIVRFDGGYLVSRGDGRYVLGATMEERGFDETVTAGGLYELLRDAGELVPGIHELVVEECSAGLRPATPDNAPLLGCDAELEGLVWATGHYRNGILLAPATAEIVAAALDGTPAPVAFAAQRFEQVAA
jgi:glycine oxidase